MFKAFYKRNQYLINLIAILVLVVFNRFLDRLAWVPNYGNKLSDAVIDFSVEFITLLPVIFLISVTYKTLINRERRFLTVAITFIYAILLPAIVLYVSTLIERYILGMTVMPVTFELIKQYTPGGAVIILFLSITYYLTYLKIKSVENIEKAHKAKTLAKEVQLKMLRYQINPHFLFNVLNSIHSLIDEDRQKAQKLIVDMSEYYRYTLNKQVQTTSVEKEIESVEKYLNIQKTRFEEYFDFEIIVDAEVKEYSIPAFIIHLLIENAVKYGSGSGMDPLNIGVKVYLEENVLIITVTNSGHLHDPNEAKANNLKGTGSGIENLKSRLALYYDNNYSFSLKEEYGLVVAKIEICKINLR